MKKIFLIWAVLVLAAPAMAEPNVVDVCAVPIGGDAVEITYTVVSGQLPRAFALDITVTDGNIISVDGFFSGECDDVNRGYGIFPANFRRYLNADFNNWDDVNYTPVAHPCDLPGGTEGGIDTNGVTIEMGSLYVDDNSPPTEGVLCVIHVSVSTDVNLWPNVGRGVVVLEDGSAPDLYLYGCSVDVGPTECTISGTVDDPCASGLAGITITGFPGDPVVTDVNGYYIATVDYGWSGTATPVYAASPNTVTFDPTYIEYISVTCDSPGPNNQNYQATQCMNPSAGTRYGLWVAKSRPQCWCYEKQCRGDTNGLLFIGKPVTLVDLNVIRDAFNKLDGVLPAGGICADLDHKKFLNKHVTLADLNIMRDYFNVLNASVPACDQAPSVPTGPYNFWTTAP